MSSGWKSEVQISDPAVLDHTYAFLNTKMPFVKADRLVTVTPCEQT